jgi:hypothetical protein
MDQELLQGSAKLSRRLDGVESVEEENGPEDVEGFAAAEEDGHVLVNLLKSLEASGGMPGPVPNMMKGMGAQVPK